MRRTLRLTCGVLLLGGLALAVVTALWAYRTYQSSGARTAQLLSWLRDPGSHPDWRVRANERCGEAPFQMPTDGYIGFLWGDSFRPGHTHQGLDIFGGAEVNVTPVYAAYPGYLTRLPDWKSSLIIRIPDDPLHPGRQIWIYYTHLAGPDGETFILPDFPPGTSERFVEAGTLLGYQGNYSGNPGNPVGVHLHFSIVLDDGSGHFRNELEFDNTLDPSPYLGLPLNASQNQDQVPVCQSSGNSGWRAHALASADPRGTRPRLLSIVGAHGVRPHVSLFPGAHGMRLYGAGYEH